MIIQALRADNALTVSLVAEIDGKIAGHIAFSAVAISDGSQNWYGLGPLSVLPYFQKQGIGESLVEGGLSLLKALGAEDCVLLGEPDYFKQFGFRNYPDLILEGFPQKYFLASPFDKSSFKGAVVYHQGFLINAEAADSL